MSQPSSTTMDESESSQHTAAHHKKLVYVSRCVSLKKKCFIIFIKLEIIVVVTSDGEVSLLLMEKCHFS